VRELKVYRTGNLGEHLLMYFEGKRYNCPYFDAKELYDRLEIGKKIKVTDKNGNDSGFLELTKSTTFGLKFRLAPFNSKISGFFAWVEIKDIYKSSLIR
jgi:hypothetical protein